MAATIINRQPAPAGPVIDPHSDVVLLVFGEGPLGYGVPGRELHGNDLLRIARVRALAESGGEPVDHATPEQLAALYDELLASGTFTASVAPASELETDPAPATAALAPAPAPTWSPGDHPDQTPVVPAPEA